MRCVDKSDTDRRDFWWLDDITSLGFITLIFLTILGGVSVVVYSAVTGAFDLGANIQVVGTIDISFLYYALIMLLVVVLYDIYGRRDVKQAVDDTVDTAEDADDLSE